MEGVWERAVESALDGQTDCSSARSLNLDGAVKYLHGRPLPPALLAKFQSLERLSLANVGVSSLENFPHLRNLQKLVLSDNRIVNGLEFLVGLDSLRDLDLSNNRIQFIEDLAPLAKLKLVSLDLYECPVTKVDNYRARVFAMIKSLRYLDNMDVHNNERPESDEEDEDDDDEEDDDDPGSGEVDSDQNAGVVDLKDGEKDDDGTTADGKTGSFRRKEKRIILSNGGREENDVQGSDEEEEDVEDEEVDGEEQCANNADVQEEEDNEDGLDEEEGDTLSADHLTSTEGEIDEPEQFEEEDGDDDDDDEGIEDGDHEVEDQDADEEEDAAAADYLVQPVVQTKGEAGSRNRDDGAEEAVDEEGCLDLPEPSSHSKRKRAEGDFDGALEDGVPVKRR